MESLAGQNLLRLFTLKEAQKLLPKVKKSLARQKKYLKDLKVVSKKLDAAPKKKSVQKPLENKIQSLVDLLNVEMDYLEALGCVCKDIEKGLVDFPSLINGEIAYLCWKDGEETIGFWHRIADGFAGRLALKPQVHFSPYWKN
jgi:hypothetical protein